jgi:phage terminase large subunit-like protein
VDCSFKGTSDSDYVVVQVWGKQGANRYLAYSPKDSKEARVSAISAQVESGCVYLPDPHLFPWVTDFVSECNSFPRAPHDDQVDAMSQALIHLSGPDRRLFTDEQIDALTAPDIRKPQAKPRQFFIEGLYRG